MNLTSERKLLSVGMTKSVVVTSTVGEKMMPIALTVLAYSERNLVSVLKVVHGKMQSEVSNPSNKLAKPFLFSCKTFCLVTVSHSFVIQIGTTPGLMLATRPFIYMSSQALQNRNVNRGNGCAGKNLNKIISNTSKLPVTGKV